MLQASSSDLRAKWSYNPIEPKSSPHDHVRERELHIKMRYSPNLVSTSMLLAPADIAACSRLP